VLEYLASLDDTRSHPGAALCGGVIRRVSRDELKPAPAQYFPGSATTHPHLDAETVAVAGYLGISNVCWMNVFDGVHTTRAMQLLAVDGERPRDLVSVQTAAKLDLFGRRTYFAIVANAHGSDGSTTVAYICPDSYRTTGALTAFAAQQIADMPAGARPFWSIDQPQRALEFLTEAVPEAELSFADDAETVTAEPVIVEEGSL